MAVALTQQVQEAKKQLQHTVDGLKGRVNVDVEQRALEASLVIHSSAMRILRGQRTGRTYRVPGTKSTYTASAPGEAPAVRTGLIRLGWLPAPNGSSPGIETTAAKLADWLNEGTLVRKGKGGMAPRPYVQPIIQDAKFGVRRIYRRPYLNGGG